LTREKGSPDAAGVLMQAWAAGLAEVIESMTGEKPEMEWRAGSFPTGAQGAAERSLCWEQSFGAEPGASLWVAAPEPSWKAIGGRILAAAGVEDGAADDIRGTFIEVLNQALAAMARTLSGRSHLETSTSGRESRPEEPPPFSFAVDAKLGAAGVTLFTGFTAELCRQAADDPQLGAGEGKSSAPKADELPLPVTAPASGRPLDLLLDVELPVSVSFGRAQLPLKDVIKLTTGSIVELNRAVSEPVEVIVNNCVIARGQIVVVEGNFGVRIQQVMSRQERLRTFK
jgi:flagellar motor switch protein FliN/FliY